MMNINLLDCTLRDGGYINEWKFGSKPIKHITQFLGESGVEYIEVGYLKDKQYSNEYTLYMNTSEILERVAPKRNRIKYVAMINYGEYPVERLKQRGEDTIDAIRVAFSKQDADNVYAYCKKIKELGYELFVQPMGTDKYSDIEFIKIVQTFNRLVPKAFYIVDSFGVLEKKDLIRYLCMADNNLSKEIGLGYHSHNNLQQAYGNAQYMVEQGFDRELYVDACVYGMGRGAGNLNTELFCRFLNANFNKNYNITSILEIIDQYIGIIMLEKFWGYSLPYYLSAKNNCHPNYARYFSEKNTLSNKSLNELIASLPHDIKQSFSEEKAENAYKNYQELYVDDANTVKELKDSFGNRKILILAPGSTLSKQSDIISAFIREYDPIVISVNIVNDRYKSDYVICTNEKRFRKIKVPKHCRLIVTSNLRDADTEYIINYSSYLCDKKLIADNPTLMMMNLLVSMGIERVYIAGFDGYTAVAEDNYYDRDLTLGTSLEIKQRKNEAIKKELKNYKGKIEIQLLTPSLYL